MFPSVPSRLRPLAIAISLSFPFSAFASSVGANLEASSDWNLPHVIETTPPSTSAFSSSIAGPSTDLSKGSASAIYDGAGNFATSVASVHDPFSSPMFVSGKSKLTFLDSFTNTTGFNQNTTFGINIKSLSLSVNSGWDGENTATFAARIYVDNSQTPVWESTASLHTGTRHYPDPDPQFTTGGSTPLSFTGGTAQYIDYDNGYNYTYSLASPFSTSIDLGQLSVGGTISIRYEIDLYAETWLYGGSASVNFDDPAGLLHDGPRGRSLSAGFNLASNVPAVPEPDSAAMLAAGLALLGSVARRRKGRR